MAKFKNVSGVDRHLALPEWFAPRLVEAGAVVDVEDDLVAHDTPAGPVGYSFDQPGVWELVEDAPAPVKGSAAEA